jgi:hypothetical protein
VHHPLLPRDGGERAVAVGLLRQLRLDEQVGDDDVGPRARERQRVRTPEPARPAGDERDAPGEVDLDGDAETLNATRFQPGCGRLLRRPEPKPPTC